MDAFVVKQMYATTEIGQESANVGAPAGGALLYVTTATGPAGKFDDAIAGGGNVVLPEKLVPGAGSGIVTEPLEILIGTVIDDAKGATFGRGGAVTEDAAGEAGGDGITAAFEPEFAEPQAAQAVAAMAQPIRNALAVDVVTIRFIITQLIFNIKHVLARNR